MLPFNKEKKGKGAKKKEAYAPEYSPKEAFQYPTFEEELMHPPGKTPRPRGRPKQSAAITPPAKSNLRLPEIPSPVSEHRIERIPVKR